MEKWKISKFSTEKFGQNQSCKLIRCKTSKLLKQNIRNVSGTIYMTYLEVEDDGPDEAEGELGIAVHDILTADVHQLDLRRVGGHYVCQTWYGLWHGMVYGNWANLLWVRKWQGICHYNFYIYD